MGEACSSHGEIINTWIIFVGKLEGKRLLKISNIRSCITVDNWARIHMTFVTGNDVRNSTLKCDIKLSEALYIG
jgi:hypothetical protein